MGILNTTKTQNGLTSQPVTQDLNKTPEPSEEIVEVVEEKESFEELTYPDLKKVAKEKGVSAKGSKKDILERLSEDSDVKDEHEVQEEQSEES